MLHRRVEDRAQLLLRIARAERAVVAPRPYSERDFWQICHNILPLIDRNIIILSVYTMEYGRDQGKCRHADEKDTLHENIVQCAASYS